VLHLLKVYLHTIVVASFTEIHFLACMSVTSYLLYIYRPCNFEILRVIAVNQNVLQVHTFKLLYSHF